MSDELKIPESIPDEGILIGWSLEHEHQKRPIGIRFGYHADDEQPEFLEPILYDHSGHLMTIAPTGAGKGTGCIIPALLRYQGPVIIIDPKGENYAVTARRRRDMGQEVVLLDPFELVEVEDAGERGSLSPLDIIDPESAQAPDDAAMLAEMIIPDAVMSTDPFWEHRARQLITGLILHVVTSRPPVLKNLGEVRYLLNQSPEDLTFTAREMVKSTSQEVRQMASILITAETKVRASIVSTAQSQMENFRGDLVNAITANSSFDLSRVTKGDPLSIYIVIPPDKLESHGRLLRLWIGVLMVAIMRRRRPPDQRTLFILDEAAQLGPLAQLRQAVTLLRGYGMQTWSFWQDLSQMKMLYPNDWETMINNCKIVQAFGFPNLRAAEAVREITGFTQAHDLLDLDTNELWLMTAGDEPVIAQLPNYLEDRVFSGLFDANPYHTPAYDDELMPRRPQRHYVRPAPRVADEPTIVRRTIDLDDLLHGDAIGTAPRPTDVDPEEARKEFMAAVEKGEVKFVDIEKMVTVPEDQRLTAMLEIKHALERMGVTVT